VTAATVLNARVLRAPVSVTRDGAVVTAVRPVRADEPVFAGHYPGHPVLPGVGVVECVLDAAAATLPDAGLVLAAVESARFRAPVHPPDELTATLTWAADGPAWTCRAEVAAGPGRVATVRLRYAPGPAAELPAPASEAAAVDLDRDGVMGLVPHRPPILLLDAVAGLVSGDRLTATHASPQWSVPLLVESWCQAAGVLSVHGRDTAPGTLLLLGTVQDAVLGAPVPPGATVEHRVRLTRADPGSAVLTGESHVDGRVVLAVRRVVVALREGEESG
jgi:3-hydroxymyristoyl/3-hydroxydecanoyl-(acyl carrier protein) dehydratase